MLNDTQKIIESDNNGGFVKLCRKFLKLKFKNI